MTVADPQNWAEYARVYARLYDLGPVKQMFTEILAATAIRSTHHVLDVGCGPGLLLEALHAWGSTPRVTGLDFSEEMLQQAWRRPYQGEADFQLADFDQPAVTWNVEPPYDRIVLAHSFYTSSDPGRLLRELSGVATDDARLVLSTPKANPDMAAVLRGHGAWIEALGGDPGVAINAILEDSAFQLIMRVNRESILDHPGYHFLAEDQLRKLFHDSGWRLTAVRSTYAGQDWLGVAERAYNEKALDSPALAGKHP